MKEKFIYTNNFNTKKKLEDLGFKLFRDNGENWIFINKENSTMNFSKLDGVIYSNRLTF